jgi:DNA-binding MarR family transcriptional regulator
MQFACQGRLALTAHFSNHDQAASVDRACAAAADGRRAARALAKWCESFQLSEPEFQALWLLGSGSYGVDQSTLARLLVYSPAQISATVERLRARGWISLLSAENDRRRNLWQLTSTGSDVIEDVLTAAVKLHIHSAEPPREAAA